MNEISWEDFQKIDMRVGTIRKAEFFAEAKKPAIKMLVDFGDEIGELNTSAQVTRRYTATELPGRQVIAVVNFPVKRIAGFKSECLVLGIVGDREDVVLLNPDQKVRNGLKIG